jgi:hypothetical protein
MRSLCVCVCVCVCVCERERERERENVSSEDMRVAPHESVWPCEREREYVSSEGMRLLLSKANACHTCRYTIRLRKALLVYV